MKEKKESLSRNIPVAIKRAVRQRCGYGCVICGALFCQYHHFDPPFNIASEHHAYGITLLCPPHHDEVTRGRISPEKVHQADKNPYSVKNKRAQYVFQDLSFPLEVGLGGLVFISANGTLFKIDGKEVLSVKYDADGVATFGGIFSTLKGEELIIEDNELVASTGHWDIDSKGREIVIRDSSREIIFHLTFIPPHRLQIVKVKNYYRNTILDSEFSKKLFLQSSNGATIDFASGFIAMGGGVELSKEGIVICGGSLVMGAEMENAFKGTTMDYLIGEVNKIKRMNL